MVARLARRTSSRPQNFKPRDHELARISSFIENMPHIAHAMVNGIKEAHAMGFVHCDLHTSNTYLDWSLMLLEGQHWPLVLYITKDAKDPKPIKEI